MLITGSLNVTAIDKTKLIKGEKGTYLDIVLIETPNGKYGDFMVVQGVTKQEREAGKRGAILGNAKYVGVSKEAPAEIPPQPDEDTVPF